MPDYTISIDCAPGTPRPDSYIKGIIAGTGLPQENLDQLITSRFFGEWTWQFKDISEDIWLNAEPLIATRLTELYYSDRIRYADWSTISKPTPPMESKTD